MNFSPHVEGESLEQTLPSTNAEIMSGKYHVLTASSFLAREEYLDSETPTESSLKF